MDIYLKKAVLQIVDRQSGDPVCSQVEMDLSVEATREFLTKKIEKIATPQTKVGQLVGTSEMAVLLQELPQKFLTTSEQLLQRWYSFYAESEEAPSADVFLVLYEESEREYFAFLKVDYKEAYTHFLQADEMGLSNQLILHRALLGGKSQKADEGLIVALDDFSYQLVEKKYSFSGEKRVYLSADVIETTPQLSLEENVKIIKKSAEKIGEKFATPLFDIVADVKEAVVETLEEDGQFQPEKLAEKIFKDNVSAKLAFQEELVERGVETETILPKEIKGVSEKKYGKQKLKLSNGIELIVPLEVYRNVDLIEFVNQPDGTISVMIKNVEDVFNRI